jgi:hypothetical protein
MVPAAVFHGIGCCDSLSRILIGTPFRVRFVNQQIHFQAKTTETTEKYTINSLCPLYFPLHVLYLYLPIRVTAAEECDARNDHLCYCR